MKSNLVSDLIHGGHFFKQQSFDVFTFCNYLCILSLSLLVAESAIPMLNSNFLPKHEGFTGKWWTYVIQRYCFISLISASLFTVHSPTAMSELYYVITHFLLLLLHYSSSASLKVFSSFYCEADTGDAIDLSLRLLLIVIVHEKCIYKTWHAHFWHFQITADTPVALLIYFWQCSCSRRVCCSIKTHLLLPSVTMDVDKSTKTEA